MTRRCSPPKRVAPPSTSDTTRWCPTVRHDVQRRHDHGHRDHRGDRHRAGVLPAGQGHLDGRARRRAAVLGGADHPDAPADRGRDRHEGRAVRAAAGGRALRVHPGLQLAGGASGAVRRLRRRRGRAATSRRPRTSTSCWRSPCSCSSATTRRASGAAASSATRSKVVKGHVAFLAPINIVEELAKPISLALRLFGNIFAGGILVALIAMFPWYIQWAPNAIWKTFDLFVGSDPGVHLRAADDPVLQPVDGTRRRHHD